MYPRPSFCTGTLLGNSPLATIAVLGSFLQRNYAGGGDDGMMIWVLGRAIGLFIELGVVGRCMMPSILSATE